ncbi:uncharacterized protein LOC122370424 isoform X2 [Amphibalanus amphitrite]|uniref:uncharacterized protein LOC122370424 isoform X2 n=1 Tax=Amphibalanus amphitrite TaxID=1232801 RepID=UPI001C909B21|nr:uncharacterized protein LOC122370424 isoform X2 [Amphibalanus amphitrite]XP_043201978.1 uncharacterized protein LOC122370424 isoform X2 [Amphibalanus amphitrite]
MLYIDYCGGSHHLHPHRAGTDALRQRVPLPLHRRRRPAPGSDSERRLRHQSEVRLYRALLAAGVPLLVAAAALWTAYLYRRGRCRDCWLCPGARKRRRMRNNFRTQCLEAGNLTTCYPSRPSQLLSQEEDRLVSQSLDEVAGLDDTDAMLDSGPRPIIRPAQRAT